LIRLFPQFTPYVENPIIEFGDKIVGIPWNDPCVLKENSKYIKTIEKIFC
jgi:hypothetical protein